MLTLCEDAILHNGTIPRGVTGIYFRLVWTYGMSDVGFNRYTEAIWKLFNKHNGDARFPEWILQELDQQWMQEYPSLQESARYVVSVHYVERLLAKLGSGDGKALERLAARVRSLVTPGSQAKAPAPRLRINNLRHQVGRASACQDF